MFRSIFGHLGSILGAKLGFKLPIKRQGKRRPTERYGKWPEMPPRGPRDDFQTAQKCFFNRPRWQKLGGNPTQDELTQDEGEYFSMVFPELGSGKTPLLPGRTRPLAKSITIFDVFRHRFWIVFPPELADRNRPKSNDNRCQGAFHLVLGFVIDFRSIFLRNLDAPIMKNRAPAAARARFLRNRHFKLTSIFDSILVLTWPHFGTTNPPKSVQKPIPRVSKKW